MHKTLFSGKDLALEVYSGGHPISIVAFEPRDRNIYATKASPFKEGYGKGLFGPLGFNEFIIKKSRNHWYQTSEILDVVGIINDLARGTRVITYGGSMGGFAAINFSTMLNAHRFIALSPLFDIQAGNAVGDVRWEHEGKVLDFGYNLIKVGACRQAEGYAFYCTNGLDEQHAYLIKRETRATLMPVEYGGHPCSFYLNEAYKLKGLVTEIARDDFDVDRFYNVLAERTLQTFYPYERQCVEFAKAGEVDQAITCIEKAIGYKQQNARLHGRLAELLFKKQDLEGAAREYRTAIDLEPEDPHYLVRMSHVCAARGDIISAIESMKLAVKFNPKKPEYHARLAEWLLAGGDLRAAEQAVLEVIRLNPKATVAPKKLQHIRDLLSAGVAA